MAELSDLNVNVSVTDRPTGFWDGVWRAIKWFAAFFKSGTGVSMKRLTIFMAANTLCYSALRLTHAICHQIWCAMPLDTQSVYLVCITYGILACMAGVAYFKRDAQGNITVESRRSLDDNKGDEDDDSASTPVPAN